MRNLFLLSFVELSNCKYKFFGRGTSYTSFVEKNLDKQGPFLRVELMFGKLISPTTVLRRNHLLASAHVGGFLRAWKTLCRDEIV